jgi:hypothetical protein
MQRDERQWDGEEICRPGEPEYEPPEHGDADDREEDGRRRHAYLSRGAGNAERRPRPE